MDPDGTDAEGEADSDTGPDYAYTWATAAAEILRLAADVLPT